MKSNSKKTTIKAVCLVVLLATMSACGTTMHAGDGFSMYGSPEGIRAYNEGLIGAINEAKTPEGTKGSHYQMVEQRNILKFRVRTQEEK